MVKTKTILILGLLIFSAFTFAAQVSYDSSSNTSTQEIRKGWNIVNDSIPKSTTCNGFYETFSFANGVPITGWTIERFYFNRSDKKYVILDNGITQRIAKNNTTQEDASKFQSLFSDGRNYNAVFFFYSNQNCSITQESINPSPESTITMTLKRGYNFVTLSDWITRGRNSVQDAFPGCDITGSWSWDPFNKEWNTVNELPTGESIVIKTNSECSINTSTASIP